MKKGKLLSLSISFMLTISMLAGCGSADKKETAQTSAPAQATTAPAKEVKITFLNSKGEIQAQLEDAAKAFSSENPGITMEVVAAAAGQSPFEKISSMYASGNAPTLYMGDASDFLKLKDKFIDLSGEKWVKDAAEGMLNDSTIDGKVITFPMTVEGFGFIYNKAVLDKAGVDPASIKTTKALEEAFKKVEASGKGALIISPMDWSLAAHFLGIGYSDQAKDLAGLDKFFQSLKEGKADLANNKVLNGLLNTFDVMKKYNTAKKDPMAVTYEKGPEVLGKGDVGFWFMGNWAWPQIKSFDTANGAYGFVPVPISDNESDYGNAGIPVTATKQVGIDKEQNGKEQQDAAKKFLEWLIYSKTGQDHLVNKASIIPAFKNVTLEPADPLGKSIKKYMAEGKTLIAITKQAPPDHWSKVGASMQKYLAGKTDRVGLLKEIEEYWKNVK